MQLKRKTIKVLMNSNFSHVSPLTAELAALECLKNQHNPVSTLVPSFLIGSSSFLPVTRTTIKTGMSSNFDQIGLLTMELAALERL